MRRARIDGTDASPDPLTRVQESELRAAARDAVEALPRRRREIFRLVRQRGLSYREAAETLGISPKTVANQMSLAMNNLRSALEPHLPRLDAREAPSPRIRSG